MYYKIESTLDTGETQCTLCQSAYLQVDASPQATQEGATYYFYVRDHLGNSRLILDSAGNYKTSFNFEPYGVELLPLNDNTGGSGNPLEKYKYTGQERDYTTNLDYMHFRYYASTMGRFLKPDNIIPNAANPQSWNLYSYVNGNPVNFNDPSGHYGNVPLGMKQSRLAPPGGSIWDMAMGMFYDESIDGMLVSYSDWTPTNNENQSQMTSIDPVGQEMADLVAYANGTTDTVPEGWETEGQQHENKTSLDYTVFTKTSTGEKVVAFAGSHSFKDWWNNITQALFGKSSQYKMAVDIVSNIKSVSAVAGYSLGGGIASFVGIKLGISAYTYNAAGLNPGMVGGRDAIKKASGLIKAYYTRQDPLHFIQQLTLLPNACGTQICVGSGWHGMSGFLFVGP